MTRPNSLDFGHPTTPIKSAAELTTALDLASPCSSSPPSVIRSPRNTFNPAWVSEQQRRTFLAHLERWSRSHDSSPHFQGEISLTPESPRDQRLELGASVSCVLRDTRFTDARKRIVIRLFLSQESMSNTDDYDCPRRRHDSMDLVDETCNNDFDTTDEIVQDTFDQPVRHSKHAHSYSMFGSYKLFVRCGAGYVSAREYFSNMYFRYLLPGKLKSRSEMRALDRSLTSKSQLLGSPPLPKDTVTIRPLFHPFKRLPSELQDMIFLTAAGLSKNYNLCHDGHFSVCRKRRGSAAISLSTMFQISKKMNEHVMPYIYHSTDMHFGLTGFTSFLWQVGPVNRPEIRRLTFHFGKLALLHCIRWLAPDSVFELLEPPVVTNPRSLQYFWRCQIQDLARELHLHTVTIDVKYVPDTDLPMIARILKGAFGSVRHLRFIESDDNGSPRQLNLDIKKLERTYDARTWREMCLGYWERHQTQQYFYKFDLMTLSTDEFQALMELDKENLER